MSDKKQENNPVEEIISAADMVELKRDMQNAKFTAWVQKNQQQLIAGVVAFVLLLVGVSLWKEQQLAQKHAAAQVYLKATNMTDGEERLMLLNTVIKDYADTGYATLARLQLAGSDDVATKKAALEVLMNNQGAPEFVWQARLDLAELLIAEGSVAEAKKVLDVHTGKQYEQQRYYLLSKVALDANEKADLIQKALDAPSNDNDLVASLKAELAVLRAVQ